MDNYPFGTTAKDIPGWTEKEGPELHICKECCTSYPSTKPLNNCFEHYGTVEELLEEAVALAESKSRLLKENATLTLDLIDAKTEIARLKKLIPTENKAVA